VQKLVENAVKYGVGSRREGGEIGISARADGSALRLRVTNPGQVADGNGRSDSTGVGLRNAAERLKLLFGSRATLTLRADGPDRVVAEVFIPLHPDPA
jgi:LytS/YehU family sensor histidine kinase